MMQQVPEALIRDIWLGVIDQASLIRLCFGPLCIGLVIFLELSQTSDDL